MASLRSFWLLLALLLASSWLLAGDSSWLLAPPGLLDNPPGSVLAPSSWLLLAPSWLHGFWLLLAPSGPQPPGFHQFSWLPPPGSSWFLQAPPEFLLAPLGFMAHGSSWLPKQKVQVVSLKCVRAVSQRSSAQQCPRRSRLACYHLYGSMFALPQGIQGAKSFEAILGYSAPLAPLPWPPWPGPGSSY